MGATVGTLLISGQYTGTPSFTLDDDAGGLFALNGDDIEVAGSLDYEAATGHTIEVSVSGITPLPAINPAQLDITVTNVLEVTLNALTLDTSTIVEGSAEDTAVGTLQDVTSGSTLSLTDDAGGRFKLSGSDIVAGATATNYASATSHNITVRETHADGSNSPNDSVIAITVTEAGSSAGEMFGFPFPITKAA